MSSGITELLRLEKTLEDCLVQYCCPSGQVTQGSVLLDLSPSDLHNFSVTAFQHTQSEKAFPYI